MNHRCYSVISPLYLLYSLITGLLKIEQYFLILEQTGPKSTRVAVVLSGCGVFDGSGYLLTHLLAQPSLLMSS